MSSGGAVGLRERKKRATHRALSTAALELSVERGVDGVTVDDIAARADVSQRTFFNYFATKEDAILADAVERGQRVAAALAARPADEPLWDALRHAFLAELTDSAAEPELDWVARVRLVKASPALASRYLANFATMEQLLRAEIARRCRLRPDHLYPRLVSATAVTAVRVAVTHWIEAPDDGATMRGTVERALRAVAGDLSPPAA